MVQLRITNANRWPRKNRSRFFSNTATDPGMSGHAVQDPPGNFATRAAQVREELPRPACFRLAKIHLLGPSDGSVVSRVLGVLEGKCCSAPARAA